MIVGIGASNLYIPGKNCIYVAPSLIAHYIAVHSYEPPEEFWNAVAGCPEMNCENYRKALLSNGPSDRRWIEAVSLVGPPPHIR